MEESCLVSDQPLLLGGYWKDVIKSKYNFNIFLKMSDSARTYTSLISSLKDQFFSINIGLPVVSKSSISKVRDENLEYQRQLFLFFHELGHLAANTFKMDVLLEEKLKPKDSLEKEIMYAGINAIDDAIINNIVEEYYTGILVEARRVIREQIYFLRNKIDFLLEQFNLGQLHYQDFTFLFTYLLQNRYPRFQMALTTPPLEINNLIVKCFRGIVTLNDYVDVREKRETWSSHFSSYMSYIEEFIKLAQFGMRNLEKEESPKESSGSKKGKSPSDGFCHAMEKTAEEIEKIAKAVEEQLKEHEKSEDADFLPYEVPNIISYFSENGLIPYFKNALEEARRGIDRKFGEVGALSVTKQIQSRRSGDPNIFRRMHQKSTENSKWFFVVDTSGSVFNTTMEDSKLSKVELEIINMFMTVLPKTAKFRIARFAKLYDEGDKIYRSITASRLKLVKYGIHDVSIDGVDTIWNLNMVKDMYEEAKKRVQVVILTDGEVIFGNEEAKDLAVKLFSNMNTKPILLFLGQSCKSFYRGIVSEAHLRDDIDFNIITSTSKANKNLVKYLKTIFWRY